MTTAQGTLQAQLDELKLKNDVSFDLLICILCIV